MKKDIHPKYYDDCVVTCTCGNTFVTGSTLPQIKVEVCAACHPFFTGEVKYVDAKGRIERFIEKQAKGKLYIKKHKGKKAKPAKQTTRKAKSTPPVLATKKPETKSA